MNPAKNIADYLEDNHLGTLGTDIFVGNLPDGVDNAIMATNLAGDQPDPYIELFTGYVELTIRNKMADTAYLNAMAVFDLLSYKANLTLADMYVYYMHPLQNVEDAGRDINGRTMQKILVKVIYRAESPIS